ncbi:hypothetical protein LMIY3S_00588 [Labrys miyagiensis]
MLWRSTFTPRSASSSISLAIVKWLPSWQRSTNQS